MYSIENIFSLSFSLKYVMSIYCFSKIKNKIMSIFAEGCLYNGQLYNQGQMWDDGCKYTCTCLNAVTGDYKCREK